MAAAKKAATYEVLAPTSTHKATNMEVGTAERVLLEAQGVAARHFLVQVSDDTIVYLEAMDGGSKKAFDEWAASEAEHPAWTFTDDTESATVAGALRYVVEQSIAQTAKETGD